MGLRRAVRRGRLPVPRVPLPALVAGAGHGRAQRAEPRARAARVEPRGQPLPVGRRDDRHRHPARAPAAALHALPGAELGVRAALRVGRDPQVRRRAGLALQRDPAARAGRARGRVPGGREGHGQGLRRPLPAPALRPRRLRGDGAAHRLADRAGRGGGQRGDLPEDRRGAAARAPRRRAVLPRHADVPAARPVRPDPAAVEVADRVLRPDRHLAVRPGRGARTRRWCSSCRSGCARRSRTRSTRTSSSAGRRSCSEAGAACRATC